jgi:pilus assembly protein CpaC
MNLKLLNSFIIIFSIQALGQITPTGSTPPIEATSQAKPATDPVDEEGEKPNGRRIRRQLNLIAGVEHDEEFLIPEKETTFKGMGATENLDIKRIKGTDFFRITPKKAATGIITIHDKKTGQILIELRYDIRSGNLEKQLRELQSLLGDIEGLEYKIVNDKILLDGYVLLPRELIRIANVVKQFPDAKSLATLSPIARKKIAEYIAKDVNNPEVSITAVGDYLKLEGVVNSKEEKDRIIRIVSLYMPDLVIEQGADLEHLKIVGRKAGGKVEDLIVDLITIKKDEEKVEPPPKMIQVVVHFVQFIESYGKNFNFVFAPSLSAINNASRAPSSTINDTANLISNLLPKLQWAKKHNYARVLDTASLLTQDKKFANYTNVISIAGSLPGPNGSVQPNNTNATVSVALTPSIKSERSGLVELDKLNVSVADVDSGKTTTNTISTTISVRDRQSAAFAGIIKKKGANEFGGDPGVADAIVTFRAAKKYDKSSSNFVVFITPIIKSSASAGVDQVKKKFRLRE